MFSVSIISINKDYIQCSPFPSFPQTMTTCNVLCSFSIISTNTENIQCSLFCFYHFHKPWQHTMFSVLFLSFPQTLTTYNILCSVSIISTNPDNIQYSLFCFHHFHKHWKHTMSSVLFPSSPQTLTTLNLFLFCFHFSKTIERTQCRLFCFHQVHHHKQQIMLSAFFPPFPLQLTVCRFLCSVSTISTTTDNISCSLFCFHNFHYHRQYIMLSVLFPSFPKTMTTYNVLCSVSIISKKPWQYTMFSVSIISINKDYIQCYPFPSFPQTLKTYNVLCSVSIITTNSDNTESFFILLPLFQDHRTHPVSSVLFPPSPPSQTANHALCFLPTISIATDSMSFSLFCFHYFHHHRQYIMLSVLFPQFPLPQTVHHALCSVSTISTTTDSTSCSLFCFHNFHYHRQYIMLSALFPALSSCVLCNHVTMPASDHKAVMKELNDQTFQLGPGYWKFNNSLLKNLSFIKMMNDGLDIVIKGCDSNCSDTDTWELCKVEIQHFGPEFEKRLSNPKRNHLLQCNIQVSEAERELIINPKDQTAQENLLKAKQKMEIIQLDKDRGAQIRARTKWIEGGERNTKYFCSLEKSRGKKKVMTELRRTMGETTTNQRFVCWLVGCLTSQQHAGVSQGRICTANFMCCHTEIEVADQTFSLTQSHYTDTGPTISRVDPIMPGAWQGSQWSANF